MSVSLSWRRWLFHATELFGVIFRELHMTGLHQWDISIEGLQWERVSGILWESRVSGNVNRDGVVGKQKNGNEIRQLHGMERKPFSHTYKVRCCHVVKLAELQTLQQIVLSFCVFKVVLLCRMHFVHYNCLLNYELSHARIFRKRKENLIRKLEEKGK